MQTTAEIHSINRNRMQESQYDQERGVLRANYGDNQTSAGARLEQELAKLFERSGWTQQELAVKEGMSQTKVSRWLCFGRFLSFMPNWHKASANLTEGRFRSFWNKTDKDAKEPDRFKATEKALVAEVEKPKPKAKRKAKADISDSRPHRGDNTPALDKACEAVRPLIRDGKPINSVKVGEEIGVSSGVVETAIYVEAALRNVYAELKVNPESLSKTGKIKLETALRVETKRLQEQNDIQFQARIAEHIKQLKAESLPRWEEDARRARVNKEYYEKLISAHAAIFTEVEYTSIVRCLHPDSRNTISVERLAEAFRLFTSKKLQLTNNGDK